MILLSRISERSYLKISKGRMVIAYDLLDDQGNSRLLGDKVHVQEVNDSEIIGLCCGVDCGHYLQDAIQVTSPYFRLPLRWGRIEVGVDVASAPSPSPSPTRGERNN